MRNFKIVTACAVAGLAVGLLGSATAQAEGVDAHDGHEHSEGWGQDGVEIPRLPQVLARFGVAPAGYSDSLREIMNSPTPTKNIKVTMVNLVTPSGKSVGMSEAQASGLVSQVNSWFRAEDVSTSDVNLIFDSVKNIKATKAYACSMFSSSSQDGVVDVTPPADIKALLSTSGGYDSALPVFLINGDGAGDNPNCFYTAGLGFVGSPGLLLNAKNGLNLRTFAHEVGHTLGLRHAAILTAAPSTSSPYLFPGDTGKDFRFDPYGDPISVMGIGLHLTETEKAALGFAGPGAKVVTTDGSYELVQGGASQAILLRHKGAVRVSLEFNEQARTARNTIQPAGVFARVIDQAKFGGSSGIYNLESAGIGMITSLGNAGQGAPVMPVGRDLLFPEVATANVTNSSAQSGTVAITGLGGGTITPPNPNPEDKTRPVFANWGTFYKAFKSSAASSLPAGTKVSLSSRTQPAQIGDIVGNIEVPVPEFTDKGSGVASVTVDVTGQPQVVLSPEQTQAETSLLIPVTSGVTAILITGSDNSGNATSKRIIVRVPSAQDDRYKPVMKNLSSFIRALKASVKKELPKGSKVSTSSRLKAKYGSAISGSIRVPMPEFEDKGGSGISYTYMSLNGETFASGEGNINFFPSMSQIVFKGVNELIVSCRDEAGNVFVKKFFIIAK